MTGTRDTGLDAELDWLAAAIAARLQAYLRNEAPTALPPPPAPDPAGSRYAALAQEAGLDPGDRLILALALAGHLVPQVLDPFLIRNSGIDRPFTEFGMIDRADTGVQPSVQTALFLLGGGTPDGTLAASVHLTPSAPLMRQHLLAPLAGETPQRQPLQAGAAALDRLGAAPHVFQGRIAGLAAQRFDTALDWDDLVLTPRSRAALDALFAWIDHGPALHRDPAFARLVPAGCRVLFHGPPGTGKSLTAALIGKRAGRPVFRVDLSMVISKYIGETEKNLATLFDAADAQGWILFFDEADALFGRRAQAVHANDRYANQNVSYILQRVEQSSGLVILATNLGTTIDRAFRRRFQVSVPFELPGPDERAALWHRAFHDPALLHEDVDLALLARQYPVTGALIANVLRRCLLGRAQRGGTTIRRADIEAALADELQKDGVTAPESP
ncbi:ATP-binding protein [Pseudaestuariivita atlantica]|nr:ATP-binding protein [Pseudaestuariivita atlantica]